jgi:adenylate kinase
LTILGAPGSGKGFYGRRLAQAWQCARYEASALLRRNPQSQELLDSGKLVDCQLVSHTLSSAISKAQKDASTDIGDHFIMDGFPRTRRQIDLMEAEWPHRMSITHAVLLDIPESVCIAKISGRRYCDKCQRHFNTVGYYNDGFDLPPVMPTSIPCDRDASCDPSLWQQRPDDANVDIVRQRLHEHAKHEQPIIEYYKQKGRLLRFTAYRGARDVEDMRQCIETWMAKQCRDVD